MKVSRRTFKPNHLGLARLFVSCNRVAHGKLHHQAPWRPVVGTQRAPHHRFSRRFLDESLLVRMQPSLSVMGGPHPHVMPPRPLRTPNDDPAVDRWPGLDPCTCSGAHEPLVDPPPNGSNPTTETSWLSAGFSRAFFSRSSRDPQITWR